METRVEIRLVTVFTAKNFRARVLELSARHQHSLFDALMALQASESLDPMDISRLLTPQLKKLLEGELHDRHLLKKPRR